MFPLVILGGLFLGAIGAEGHSEAKQTNKKAESLITEAKTMYDNAKEEAEEAQEKAKQTLIKFGKAKKIVLETTMDQFINNYEYIKEIKLMTKNTAEYIEYSINIEDMLKIRELKNIYKSTILTGGAATAALMTFGANGLMSVSAIGASMAAGGLTFAPIVAPLMGPFTLASALAASFKADENLEKAQTTYAEAEAASEEYKVIKTMYNGVINDAKMLEELLYKVNEIFSAYVVEMVKIVDEKIKKTTEKKIDNLNDDEIEVIAITRSLAGAVKAIIDAPIMDEKGERTKEAKKISDNINKEFKGFLNTADNVKDWEYTNIFEYRQDDLKEENKVFVEGEVVCQNNGMIGVYNEEFDKCVIAFQEEKLTEEICEKKVKIYGKYRGKYEEYDIVGIEVMIEI